MAWNEKHVTATGTDTYSNASSSSTPCSLATAISGAAAGDRINIKAGTYANTTTSRTFGTAGTTTAPVWWRGYTTTIGDLDYTSGTLTPGTDFPDFTWTTGAPTFNGNHTIFSNLRFASAGTFGASFISGVNLRFVRCRFENTGVSGSTSFASQMSGSRSYRFEMCQFKAGSASSPVVEQGGTQATFALCTFEGGGVGMTLVQFGSTILEECIFRSNASHGLQLASSVPNIVHAMRCSFAGCGGDGIRLTVLPGQPMIVWRSIFSGCGGYGFNNATGSNTSLVSLMGSVFYNNTSGTVTGLGDWPSLLEATESSTPFTNSGTGDYSLVSGANSRAAQPRVFENLATTSYADAGAAQHQDSGGGGSSGARLVGPSALVTPGGCLS
jgi:hypothetical protein